MDSRAQRLQSELHSVMLSFFISSRPAFDQKKGNINTATREYAQQAVEAARDQRPHCRVAITGIFNS